jgi:hypothetical protein
MLFLMERLPALRFLKLGLIFNSKVDFFVGEFITEKLENWKP